jgi:nucleoside-diphosphate-sugar epimerase
MKCLVTGGGGFLGKALCRALRSRGDEVISLSRGVYPELEQLGVKTIQGDIATLTVGQLTNYLTGIDVVFHVAAKVKMWGSYDDFHQANVAATERLLESSIVADVTRFIYTSSPSVIAHGVDLRGVDESYPYPDNHENYYSQTKAIAEQKVRAVGYEKRLKTISLRPHLIFGPGDTSLTKTVLERGAKRKLFKIGAAQNISDFTFIDDCVAAHLLAADALARDSGLSGNVYFISQGDPVPMWGWIDRLLALHNLPPITQNVPLKIAKIIATLSELRSTYAPWFGEPRLTHFLLSELTTDHFFLINAAKKDLGYSPQFRVFEALERFCSCR